MKKSEWPDKRNELVRYYEGELKRLGLKGAKLKDLTAGFEDGISNTLMVLNQLGAISWEDEEKQ
jgi:hypothetical protein